MPTRPKRSPADLTQALEPRQYQRLIAALRRLLTRGRQRAEEALGQELVQTYHAIGTRLLAAGPSRTAAYGSAILQRIADDLTLDVRTLQRAIAFARAYPDGPPKGGLRWGHYRELLVLPEPQQRDWYEAEAVAQQWSAPKLREAVREEQYRNQITATRPAKRLAKARKTLRRPAETTYIYKAVIERVVDGDTLLALVDLGFQVHKQQRLRLAGIDTPALGTPKGDRATKLVEQELAQVDFCIVKTNKIDLYGRYVAHVFYEPGERNKHKIFSEGQYLNQRLVEEGVAKVL